MSNQSKVVVVTGVSSGIGRATAEMFLKKDVTSLVRFVTLDSVERSQVLNW